MVSNIYKRVSQSLEIVKLIFINPKKFILEGYGAVAEEKKRKKISQKYKLKRGLPFVDMLDLFPNFKEVKISRYSFLNGTSSPSDLMLLKLFAKNIKDCNYLEIGSMRGESLAAISDATKKCTSISLSADELRTMGHSEEYIKMQRCFSKGLNNVLHIQHNSHTFDYSKFREKFDLIFIDGDHHYESVKIDTKNAFNLLKDENSIIVWHDCGKNAETPDWTVLAGVLDGCPPEKRKNLYRVTNTMCAIYYPKKIKSKFLNFPQTPTKEFTIKISAKPTKF